jgi:hypothetical protein
MKKIFQSLTILLICFLLFPLYPIKAELNPKLLVSQEILNFDRCTKYDIPAIRFTVSNQNKGPINVKFKPSKDWIHIATISYEENSQVYAVTLDATNLDKPFLYLEKIEIESDGGNYTLPIRLDLVEKRVKIKLVLDNPIVEVDGKSIRDEFGSATFLSKGITRLPLRIIYESFGAKVDYQQDIKLITITYQDIIILLTFATNKIIVNGKDVEIQDELLIRFRRAYIPIKMIKQVFIGANVNYDPPTRSVTIIY